jgi:hypothetical protein
MNQKAYDHIDKLDNEYFNDLRDKYVPGMGAAETRAGEIIRAMDRLIYRFFNDGDMVGKGYGNETCNSSYRYLRRRLGPGCPELQASVTRSRNSLKPVLSFSLGRTMRIPALRLMRTVTGTVRTMTSMTKTLTIKNQQI